MKKNIWSVIVLVMISSCLDRNPDSRTLYVGNNTTGIVYYYLSTSDSVDDKHLEYDEKMFNKLFKVDINDTTFSVDKPDNWEDFINESKEGKMRLFIISKDSVDKYGWKGVLAKNIYTKVYKLNIDDLKNNKWLIVYNGK